MPSSRRTIAAIRRRRGSWRLRIAPVHLRGAEAQFHLAMALMKKVGPAISEHLGDPEFPTFSIDQETIDAFVAEHTAKTQVRRGTKSTS